MDIEKLLRELTLEEKAKLTMGKNAWSTWDIDRLNIPSIKMSDGPHGLRNQYDSVKNSVGLSTSIPATCFPPASLTSCSFNRENMYKIGEAMAKEAIHQNVDIILGPAINIKRSPLCGRNFEYVSEDPYLAGEYATEFTKGVQSKGIGVSLKHFVANNQETSRMTIDSVVDERTLREIYLYPFEKAIKNANPYTVMASYNRINGEYGCENSYTLTDILRNQWKYTGCVVSDWAAINDKIKSIQAGCDLEMPTGGKFRVKEVIKAVKKGELDESILDKRVENVLKLIKKCKKDKVHIDENIYEENHNLARKVASDSMVLLKNEDNILPFKKDKKYSLIGAFAKVPKYQGGGSSHITSTKVTSMNEIFEKENINFTYSMGYDVNTDECDEDLIKDAIDKAKNSDIAIVFIGLTDIYEFECLDRKSLELPQNHTKLLEEVCKVNKNVVVVLCAGSVVNMNWDTLPKGILYASVGGQAVSESVFDILFGYVNPSGKLTETVPINLKDTPSYSNFPGGDKSVYYAEGIYVGYRYYLTSKTKVKYPFGFGLSYTDFEYRDIKVDKNILKENNKIKINLKIKNVGQTSGGEVVQVYIKNTSDNTFNADMILRNFDKVYLEPNEEKDIELTLGYSDFERYDVRDGWVCDNGVYEIIVARSSVDIEKRISINVEGKGRKDETYLKSYREVLDNNFVLDDFEKLYGKKLPTIDNESIDININTRLKYLRGNLAGKIVYKLSVDEIERSNAGDDGIAARKAMLIALDDTPLRFLVLMDGGKINIKTGYAVVAFARKRYILSIKELIESLM